MCWLNPAGPVASAQALPSCALCPAVPWGSASSTMLIYTVGTVQFLVAVGLRSPAVGR